MRTMAQQTPKDGASNPGFPVRDRGRALTACRGERGLFGLLAGILLPLLELLDEGFSLLLIGEGEPSGAVLEFERVEERPVLIVVEIVVDFLVPDHTFPSRLYIETWSAFIDLSPSHPGTGGEDSAWDPSALTEISTIFNQNVRPTRSFASTAAPCKPVYTHR